jgi:molecular chaperone GrpE (heat shock protein)
MSEWSSIEDLQGWKDKLGELLAEARKAALQEELAPRIGINERLMQFVENSWPNSSEITALDEIATQTASALLRQTIEERLRTITERTGEYQRLGKQFAAIAEENEAKADSIRLGAITSFIDSTTRLVDSAKALQNSLNDNAADQKLGEKIAQMIAALEALRSSVGKRI